MRGQLGSYGLFDVQILDDFDDLIVSLFVTLRAEDANGYSKILSTLLDVFEMGLAGDCLPSEVVCSYFHVFGLLLNDDAEVIFLFAIVRLMQMCEGVEVVQERFVRIIGNGIIFI